jgi:hypothetical protein
MNHRGYAFLIAAGFILSCNSNNQNTPGEMKAKEEDITDSAIALNNENTFSGETIAVMNQTGFSKYARSRSAQFDWDKFTMTQFWKEDFVHKIPFIPAKNYFELYGKFLKYSPDSSRFIDLDSYNISLKRDNSGRLIGYEQEPDTEVSLVDLDKKQQLRLLFLGPGNSVEDATWIDNNNFILIGFQEKANSTGTSAVVWKYDLASKMVHVYEMPDESLVKSLKDYSYKERLKGVTIQ